MIFPTFPFKLALHIRLGWIEHESGDLSLIDNSGTFPEVAPALEGSRLEGKLGQAMLTQFNGGESACYSAEAA